MIRSKGEAGTGNVVEAVRHLRQIKNEIARLRGFDNNELYAAAKDLAPPTSWSRRSRSWASCPSCSSPPVASPPRPTPR